MRDKSKHNTELKSKFDKIDSYIENNLDNSNANEESSSRNELELSMTQFKDGTISWNIDNKSIRETVKLLFPVYYIDTRKLDIFTWEHLWKIISDLYNPLDTLKTNNKNQKLKIKLIQSKS